MTAWLIVAGYALASLLAARVVLRALRESVPDEDITDAVTSGLIALVCGLFWPLALPIALVLVHPKPTSAEVGAAEREHEAEKRELRRRISELEREMGIGGQR